MKETLLKKLTEVNRIYGYSVDNLGLDKEIIQEMRGIFGIVKDQYREGLINRDYLNNEVVRGAISGKLKFCEVGESITEKASSVYEYVKNLDRTYKFRKEEIIEAPECVNAIQKLGGVVDLEDYFESRRIPGKKLNNTLSKYFSKNENRKTIDVCGLGISSSVLGGILSWPGGTFVALLITSGVSFASIYPYVLLENTPEKIIKEPAERLEKDLIWLDETFERIYRK